MKKIFLSSFIFLLVISTVLAASPPWKPYCELQGYTFTYQREFDKKTCVFDDGNSCDAVEFFEGTCGQEYVVNIPCRELGDELSSVEHCCDGLEPVGRGFDQPICLKKLSFWGKVLNFFASIF